MRTAKKNKQKLYYALQNQREEIPVIENGVIKTIVVDGVTVNVGSGSFDTTYFSPVEFYANISTSSGEVSIEEFGVDVGQYDAVIVADKGALPITETSLVWHLTTPSFLDANNTLVDPKTADYRVLAIKPTLNEFKAVLKRITK